MEIDVNALEYVRRLHFRGHTLEVDLFMSSGAVQDKGSRPFYPNIFLAVDANNGMVLGHEMLPPIPSLEKMWSTFPNFLVKHLEKLNLKPNSIKTPTPQVYQLLLPLGSDLGIKIELTGDLPMLFEARSSLNSFMSRRF